MYRQGSDPHQFRPVPVAPPPPNVMQMGQYSSHNVMMPSPMQPPSGPSAMSPSISMSGRGPLMLPSLQATSMQLLGPPSLPSTTPSAVGRYVMPQSQFSFTASSPMPLPRHPAAVSLAPGPPLPMVQQSPPIPPAQQFPPVPMVQQAPPVSAGQQLPLVPMVHYPPPPPVPVAHVPSVTMAQQSSSVLLPINSLLPMNSVHQNPLIPQTGHVPPAFVPPLPPSPPADNPPPPPPSPPPPLPPPPPLEDIGVGKTLPLDPCRPSDPEILRHIEVLVPYVVKNGPAFENFTRSNNLGDPKFAFLSDDSWDSEAIIARDYYKWKKKSFQLQNAMEDKEIMQLDCGNMPKQVQEVPLQNTGRAEITVPSSPEMSDMDTDDDFTISSPRKENIREPRQSATGAKSEISPSKLKSPRQHVDDILLDAKRNMIDKETGIDMLLPADVPHQMSNIYPPRHLMELEKQVTTQSEEHHTVRVSRSPPPLLPRIIQGSQDDGKLNETVHGLFENRYQDDEKQNWAVDNEVPCRPGREDLASPRMSRSPHIYFQIDSRGGGRKELANLRNRIPERIFVDDTKREHDSESEEIEHARNCRRSCSWSRSGSSSRSRSKSSSRGRSIDRDRMRGRKRSSSRSWSPLGSHSRRQSFISSDRKRKWSRSWSRSPLRQRSYSRTPPRESRWGGSGRGARDSRGEHEFYRRGRRAPCIHFARGRCFRGMSCRYAHDDRDIIAHDCGLWMKNERRRLLNVRDRETVLQERDAWSRGWSPEFIPQDNERDRGGWPREGGAQSERSEAFHNCIDDSIVESKSTCIKEIGVKNTGSRDLGVNNDVQILERERVDTLVQSETQSALSIPQAFSSLKEADILVHPVPLNAHFDGSMAWDGGMRMREAEIEVTGARDFRGNHDNLKSQRVEHAHVMCQDEGVVAVHQPFTHSKELDMLIGCKNSDFNKAESESARDFVVARIGDEKVDRIEDLKSAKLFGVQDAVADFKTGDEMIDRIQDFKPGMLQDEQDAMADSKAVAALDLDPSAEIMISHEEQVHCEDTVEMNAHVNVNETDSCQGTQICSTGDVDVENVTNIKIEQTVDGFTEDKEAEVRGLGLGGADEIDKAVLVFEQREAAIGVSEIFHSSVPKSPEIDGEHKQEEMDASCKEEMNIAVEGRQDLLETKADDMPATHKGILEHVEGSWTIKQELPSSPVPCSLAVPSHAASLSSGSFSLAVPSLVAPLVSHSWINSMVIPHSSTAASSSYGQPLLPFGQSLQLGTIHQAPIAPQSSLAPGFTTPYSKPSLVVPSSGLFNALQPETSGRQPFSQLLSSGFFNALQPETSGRQPFSQLFVEQPIVSGGNVAPRQSFPSNNVSQFWPNSIQFPTIEVPLRTPTFGTAALLSRPGLPHNSVISGQSPQVGYPGNPASQPPQVGYPANQHVGFLTRQGSVNFPPLHAHNFPLPLERPTLSRPFMSDAVMRYSHTSSMDSVVENAYASPSAFPSPLAQSSVPWTLGESSQRTEQFPLYSYSPTTVPPLKVPGATELKSSADQYDPLFDSLDPYPSVVHSEMITRKPDPTEAEAANVHEAGADVGVVENVSPPAQFSPEQALDEADVQDQTSKNKKSTRGLKLLRSAVAEHVKELLKPTWREGHLSKEAFKTIARKAVDKVTGNLPSHHIPKSQEKVEHFMAISRKKISKLVQGYVDKYLKL